MNNLPFVIIQIVCCLVLLFELFITLSQKPSKLQKITSIMVLMCIVSSIAYIFELSATEEGEALFGCYFGYVAKPFVLVSILCFLIEYSNIKVPKWVIPVVTVFFIFLSTMNFTNYYHNLYYTWVNFDPNRIGSGLKLGHGPFWFAYMASTVVIFIVFLVLTIIEYKKSVTKQARQMVILIFLMLFFGVVGLLLYAVGLTGGYDTTLTGIFLGALMLFILLVKYRLFDTVTLAKENFLVDNKDALLVFDARSRLSFYNNNAKMLFPELEKADSFKFKENELLTKLQTLNNGDPVFVDDKVYEMKKNIITRETKKNPLMIGQSYTFTDITESYYYQKTLNEDIEKATSQIKYIQTSILISMANLIEARDGCTGTHVKHVATYSKLLAEALRKDKEFSKQIDDKFIKMIEECAPLHDVGKIKVPDAILGKKGKLTSEEYEIMKTHSIEGAKIIESAFRNVEEKMYVDMCKDIAKYHHEWYDGSGYPSKIKGNKIPLSARIMAICDVYDALRMERPYKPSFSKEKSLEIIKEESGTHFDPKIVKIFLSLEKSLD